MNLSETQSAFWRIVRGEADDETVDRVFLGTPNLSARERMRIYRNMYWWRQIDALRADFGGVVALLGDERFYFAAEAYIKAHPSEDACLERLGRLLPDWLRAQDDPLLRSAADLAALEWLRSQAFLAPDPEAIARIQDVEEQAFATSRLGLVPSLQLVELASDAERQWDDARSDPASVDTAPLPEPALHAAWRKGFRVTHKRLGADEAAALLHIRAGGTLGSACDAFANAPDPAVRAFEVIRLWFSRGWIAAIYAQSCQEGLS